MFRFFLLYSRLLVVLGCVRGRVLKGKKRVATGSRFCYPFLVHHVEYVPFGVRLSLSRVRFSLLLFAKA